MKWQIWFLSVSLILVTGSFYLNSLKDKRDEKPVQQNTNSTVICKSDADTSSWREYISSLGFSIKIPPLVDTVNRCYSGGEGTAPLSVFEDDVDNVVYISPEYYYDYGDHSDCKKITFTLDYLKSQGKTAKPFLSWKIDMVNVLGKSDIDKFIKADYDSSCAAGEFSANDDGTYSVVITGEDWDNGGMENSSCSWEMHYKILYSSEKHKLLSIKLAADYDFYLSQNGVFYDYGPEMLSSLRFR